MHELHERLMADPVIRKRIEGDTAMQRMMQQAMEVPVMGAKKPAKPAAKPKPTAKPKPPMKPMPGMKHP